MLRKYFIVSKDFRELVTWHS